MEQLLLHLWSDYITQTDDMAINKTKDVKFAILHGFIYTLPFLLLTQSILSLTLIFLTHVIIDRFRLAKYVIFYKNKLSNKNLDWSECDDETGFVKSRPKYITFWLMIIVDNTLHLTLNFIILTL